jgi:glycosyltransferase involved in cell wall biosynthesis
MKILILNWRDIKNPSGGGAELLTQEMAKRWVKAGHTVTQISSAFPKSKSKEVIDGVTFIRRGAWWNVQFFAMYYYLRYLQKRTDIIIDEVHWFPFFSYLYAPKKTVAFVCEVANKLFFTIFPFPIALCWRLIEKFYLKVYKKVPVMVISQSTREDLIKEGHAKGNIVVLPMGLSVPKKNHDYPKEKNPTLIYVARLNKQKGIFDTLDAFRLVKNEISKAKLWIVGSGDGDTIAHVNKQLNKLQLESSVTLFGFVSEEKKFELLSKAHLLISASVQEGWGLTIPEAGLTKTPAIVYNTQGFRDIIENKNDGILVEPNPKALAKGILKVLKDKKLYRKLQLAVVKKAKQYSWDNTSNKSLQFLNQYE